LTPTSAIPTTANQSTTSGYPDLSGGSYAQQLFDQYIQGMAGPGGGTGQYAQNSNLS
jgi:hypothetical protein